MRKHVLAGVLLLGAQAGSGAAQQHQQIPPPAPGSLDSPSDLSRVPTTTNDNELSRAQAYQQRLRDEDRRKRMLADAQHLLALSAELKTEIEQTSGSGVSATVAQKAAQAEKLARELGKLNKDQPY